MGARAAAVDARVDDDEVGTADDARGGTWLTYRYRFGGGAAAEAAGTMKAPSFLSAARRILARGLADAIGPEPAYLRLRAAGEQEVLLRAVRTPVGADGELRLEVVPNDTYHFAPRRDPDEAEEGRPLGAARRRARPPRPGISG